MRLMQTVHGRYLVGQRGGLEMQPDLIDQYLRDLCARGRVNGTINLYRLYLGQLYRFLPEDKCIRPDTLERWQQHLHRKGYTARTINVHLSAANSFLQFCGRRDLQMEIRLPEKKAETPTATRAEYIRLLQAARNDGKERLYLLIKMFGATGLSVSSLPDVTVAAVERGVIETEKKEHIHLPDCLRQELLDYARRQGVRSGQVFLTRSGKPVSRTNVSDSIRRLCRDAQVPEEKGSPRCLRRMYQQTREDMQQNITALLDQAYERLLEKEQQSVGWDTR